ncbi:MAG: hypothetical protein WC212_06640 [Candidatus Delongbacteria bacterium]
MFNCKKNIVDDINSVLQANGISEKIDINDISVSNVVTDGYYAVHCLSDLIMSNLWPSIKSEEVYHFTSKVAAESMINSQIFRFYNIMKRIDDGEIYTFCENHSLSGYLEKDDNGEMLYKSLIAPKIFYSSFSETTLTQVQEKLLWDKFAKKGVRLKFRITTRKNKTDFRKMVYEYKEGEPIKILKELSRAIKKYKRNFILARISTLCAFFLSKHFDMECECRAVYNKWHHDRGLCSNIDKDGHKFVEIPINRENDTGYFIELQEICSDEKLEISDKYKVLKRTN